MNKKISLLLTLVLITVIAFTITGCNSVRTSKDYYLYTYDALVGNFVKSNAKIEFKKDTYELYNNNGRVIDVGNHSTNNGLVSFVQDKRGANYNQIANVFNMYAYKSYLVETTQMTSRVSELTYEDRSDLEGVYDAGFMLKDGVIYDSIDGSNVESSFIEKAGTYSINKNKDFITTVDNDGTVNILLMMTYVDAFGYKVKALAARFYTYRSPRLKDVEVSAVELENKVFLNKSTGGGSAAYELALMSYPNKERVGGTITYAIVGTNANATISGSTLNYTGTGSVQIEYTYGNIKDTEWVYIVDLKIKDTLTAADRTYDVGDIEDYDDILWALADYDGHWFGYESVTISNEAKAESKNGAVRFKEVGTVDATLTIRYVSTFKDGSTKVVEKSQNVNIIIE